MGEYYRADIVIGGHSWTIEKGDLADYGPVMVRFGWALEESDLPPDPPSPAYANIDLIVENAADLADLDTGQPVAIRLHLTPGVETPANTPFSFYGRVAEATAIPHHLGMLYRVSCDDYLADLSDELVGATAWPTEHHRTRIARTLVHNGATNLAEFPANMPSINATGGLGVQFYGQFLAGNRAAKLAAAAGLMLRAIKQFVTPTIGANVNTFDNAAVVRGIVVHPYATDTGPGRPDGKLFAVDWRHIANPSPLPGVATLTAGLLAITMPIEPARGVISGDFCRTDAATWSRDLKAKTNGIVTKFLTSGDADPIGVFATTAEKILERSGQFNPRRYFASLDTDIAFGSDLDLQPLLDHYLTDDEITGWACDEFSHLTHADPNTLPQMWANPANHTPAGTVGRSEFYTRPIVVTTIAGRHNPNDPSPSSFVAGQLVAAEIAVSRGKVALKFSLNQRIPSPAIATANTPGTDYFSIDDFTVSGVSIDQIAPEVTLTHLRLVRSP